MLSFSFAQHPMQGCQILFSFAQHPMQGCQILLGATNQNGENSQIPTRYVHQMSKNIPTNFKIPIQNIPKYSILMPSIHAIPKIGILGMQILHQATLPSRTYYVSFF
jgi:hypothetical protein